MTDDKERWYRPGAVAKMLQTSTYAIRERARHGVIESKIENGFTYIPGREVERIRREGRLPPMPANPGGGDNAHEGGDHPEPSPTPTRSRAGMQDLYAEPSKQLARSKEKVIRLEHAVAAKQLVQQSRAIDEAARLERQQKQEAQRVKDWHDALIRRVVARVPAEVCAGACAATEELVARVPPCTDVAAKVDEIIAERLRPIREREEQARRILGHKNRIAAAVLRVSLPHGATSAELAEAREVAQEAATALPIGCSDRQLTAAIEGSTASITARIQRRNEEADLRTQTQIHNLQISQMLEWCAPFDATAEEANQARRSVRAALEQLPVTATLAEMTAAKERAVAPISAAIRQRKEAADQQRAKEREATQRRETAARRADAFLSSQVENFIRELEEDGEITVESFSDRITLRDSIQKRIRPMVIQEIADEPRMTDRQIQDFIDEVSEENWEDFVDD